MNTKDEIYDALQECVDAIDNIQAEELHHLWNSKRVKSEDFIDDLSDRYGTYQATKEHIRKAMRELEGIFE